MDSTLVKEFKDGYLIHAEFHSARLESMLQEISPKVQLIVTDPPYNGIVNEKWDKKESQHKFADKLIYWIQCMEKYVDKGSACYFWGGIGKPGHRPFFEMMSRLETETKWKMLNLITWGKKRAYGTKYNYLFTREELIYMVYDNDKPSVFNIPLLEKKRGYAGYNEKYPAKSEYLRRTNVWTDITEIFRGKIHECEKPEKLYEMPIMVHTNEGDTIMDPFAGSGTAAIAAIDTRRRFVCVESDPEIFELAYQRILKRYNNNDEKGNRKEISC